MKAIRSSIYCRWCCLSCPCALDWPFDTRCSAVSSSDHSFCALREREKDINKISIVNCQFGLLCCWCGGEDTHTQWTRMWCYGLANASASSATNTNKVCIEHCRTVSTALMINRALPLMMLVVVVVVVVVVFVAVVFLCASQQTTTCTIMMMLMLLLGLLFCLSL